MSLKTQLQAALAYVNTKLAAKGASEAATVYGIGDRIETISTGIEPTESTASQINSTVQDYLDWLEENPYSAADMTVSYFDNHSVTASYQNYPAGVSVTVGNGTLCVNDEYTGLSFKESVSSSSKTIYNVVKGNYVNLDSNGDIINCGTVSQSGSIRMIKCHAGNVRDLGGWACDGGTVKYGMLFRGREIDADDIPVLVNQCGIRRELNLRGSETSNTASPLGSTVKFYRPPVFNQYTLTNAYMKNTVEYVFDAVKNNEPLYFHCYAGADRTGTLALILEAILGVSQTDIDIDYELTTFYFGTGTDISKRARNETDWVNLITAINALTGSTFRDKVLNYLGSLGITAKQINAFRHSMIDGNPQDIELESDNRSVTNTLTHCSSSNPDSTVKVGESYSATITPDTGYVIHSEDISVVMNNVDVTASVYNNGVITIPEITGNIVITITATQPIVYTNQIPISTDANGNIYNTTGYKDGYRLNSSAVDAALAGSVVTGFIPVQAGDVIRFAGEYICNEVGGENTWFYKSDKTKADVTNITPYKLKNADPSLTVFEPYNYDATNKRLLSFTVPNDNTVAYMRCSLHASSGANAIITVNEAVSSAKENLLTMNDGNINKRIKSDGSLAAQNGYFVTDYFEFDYQASSGLRIDNGVSHFGSIGSSAMYGECRLAVYDASKNYLGVWNLRNAMQSTLNGCALITTDSNDFVISDLATACSSTPAGGTYPSSFNNVKYIRMCLAINNSTSAISSVSDVTGSNLAIYAE